MPVEPLKTSRNYCFLPQADGSAEVWVPLFCYALEEEAGLQPGAVL